MSTMDVVELFLREYYNYNYKYFLTGKLKQLHRGNYFNSVNNELFDNIK
jgi:hypothetical protein